MLKMLENPIPHFLNRKLGQAVQGLTCDMINGITQTDTLEATQTLAKSFNLLSRTQVRHPFIYFVTFFIFCPQPHPTFV